MCRENTDRPAVGYGRKGLVNRRVYAEVPPQVEYSLTDLGKILKPILYAMRIRGEGYKSQNCIGMFRNSIEMQRLAGAKAKIKPRTCPFDHFPL